MAQAKPSCQAQQGATKSTHPALQLPAGYQANGPDQSGIPLGSFSESSLDILGMNASFLYPPPPPLMPRTLSPYASCVILFRVHASSFVGGNPEICPATCASHVPLPCAHPMRPTCPSHAHLLCTAPTWPYHVLLPSAPSMKSSCPCRWVRSVAVDPGNEWFATGSADRTIKIWDLASGQLKLTLTGHIEQVHLRTVRLQWGCQGGGEGGRGQRARKSCLYDLYSLCKDVQHVRYRMYSYQE